MSMGMSGGYNSGGNYSAGDAASARSTANAVQRDLRHVEERLERLTLVCMAMWSLIQDKTDVTEQDLLARVKMLDQMDGEADGKATRGLTKCGQCGRTMSARHAKCLYCGAQPRHESAFDAV